MRTDAAGRGSAPGRPRTSRLAALVAAAAVLFSLVAGAVTATAEPAASPAPGSDRPLWAMDQSNLFQGFERSDFNEKDGSPRPLPAPDGRTGLQFQLEPGDQRSELEPDTPDQREGQVQWYTYSSQLADNFPTDVDTWQVILQWHHAGDSGSPPVAVEVRGGRLEIAAEGENFQDLGPVEGGDQVNLTLRILFSQDSSKGTVDVWRDGRHALQGFRPPGGTMLDDRDYLKVGYYRDEGIEQFGRLWLQDLRVGPTLDSVRDGDDGPAASIPREQDPGVNPPSSGGSSGDDSSGALPWIGGALLVALVALGVSLVARRRQRQ